jgi:hypothetical protein
MSGYRLINSFKNPAAPANVIYSQWIGYLEEKHAGGLGIQQHAKHPSVTKTRRVRH